MINISIEFFKNSEIQKFSVHSAKWIPLDFNLIHQIFEYLFYTKFEIMWKNSWQLREKIPLVPLMLNFMCHLG